MDCTYWCSFTLRVEVCGGGLCAEPRLGNLKLQHSHFVVLESCVKYPVVEIAKWLHYPVESALVEYLQKTRTVLKSPLLTIKRSRLV